MKIGLIVIIGLILLGIVFAVFMLIPTDKNESSKSLNWHTDLNSALNTAQNSNKLVLVDVYAPWCGWCKEMDKNTFQNPQVQQKLSNYVLVRVNGDENPDLTRKYQVYSYPTILILDSTGNLIKTITGYQDPVDFINMI